MEKPRRPVVVTGKGEGRGRGPRGEAIRGGAFLMGDCPVPRETLPPFNGVPPTPFPLPVVPPPSGSPPSGNFALRPRPSPELPLGGNKLGRFAACSGGASNGYWEPRPGMNCP